MCHVCIVLLSLPIHVHVQCTCIYMYVYSNILLNNTVTSLPFSLFLYLPTTSLSSQDEVEYVITEVWFQLINPATGLVPQNHRYRCAPLPTPTLLSPPTMYMYMYVIYIRSVIMTYMYCDVITSTLFEFWPIFNSPKKKFL